MRLKNKEMRNMKAAQMKSTSIMICANLDTLPNENVDDQSNTLEDLLMNDHYL